MAFKPLNKLFRPWMSNNATNCHQATFNCSLNSYFKCLDNCSQNCDYFYANTGHPYLNYHSLLTSNQCWQQLSSASSGANQFLSNCVNTNHTNNMFAKHHKNRDQRVSPSHPNQCSNSVTNNTQIKTKSQLDLNTNTNHNNKMWISRIKRQRPKRFHCPHCHIAFSNNGQLKGHIRTHTGERPYVCDNRECGKSFTRNEELTRHRRIHSGVRPYGCNVCTKRFGRKDHLKKHQRTHEKRYYGLTQASNCHVTASTATPGPIDTVGPELASRSSSHHQMSAQFYNHSMYLQISRHHYL